jgi:hypothetical protein
MYSTCQPTCQHTCINTCGSTCDTQTCQSTCSGEECNPCEECEDPEGIIYLGVNEEYEFESPCPEGGITTWDAPGGEPSHGEGEIFSTKFSTPGQKTVTIEWEEDGCSDETEFIVIVGYVDFDIDSDNDDGFNEPERDDNEEDLEEQKPGKLVFTGIGDSDNDGVPDYADGGRTKI